MNRNNNCGCGNTSCGCKIQTTTTNCCSTTSCPPPVVCIPAAPVQPGANPPKITVENLLKLIEAKCDKETCKLLQYEMELLYLLLGLDRPDKPGVPGVKPPVLDVTKFQLVSNMVDTLVGADLKDKYPSAELLKKELMAIWKCMYNKQQHHGEWKDNFTYRNVSAPTGNANCIIDGGKDPAPGKIKVITPVDVGSTVFHTIGGKKCLFESLVDNNITPPSKLAVLDGLWINYCDIKEVIDCVIPRRKLVDCKDACSDPDKDGVIEDKKLCERVKCIETQICDTDCKPGDPTLCDRTVKLEACVLPKGKPTLCKRVDDLTVIVGDIKTNPYITNIVRTNSGYVATRSDGSTFPMPFPKGKGSYARFKRAKYVSNAQDVFTHVPISNILDAGTVPSVTLAAGDLKAIEPGMYAIQVMLTHHGEQSSEYNTTCRLSLTAGAATVNAFFADNNHKGEFRQAILSWTGMLKANDGISISVDDGMFWLWEDPRYTQVTVTKVGE